MTDDLVLKVGALKVVSDYTKQAYDEAREQIAPTMERGDRKTVRSPLDGSKLASVSLSDPKPVALVTDNSKLTAWVEQNYPEAMASGYQVIGSDREVIDVLFEHAPHLLRKVAKVDPDWIKAVKQESTKLGMVVGPGGEADVPGLEISTPNAVVSTTPTDDALAGVVELFRAQRLSLETLRELPDGAA